MVFCYKIITESPLRSGCPSPRKASPNGRLPEIASSVSQLINSLDYEALDESLIEDIPEREWRLLATLARKREKDIEREKLADEFRRMWQREKDERNLVATETSEQYKRYILRKREKEQLVHELRSHQRVTEEQMRQGLLIDTIRYKEKRSANLLASRLDRKATEIVERAIEDEARAILAADRRSKLTAAEEWRRRADLMDDLQRAEDAAKRRDAMLRDTARRVAITNALSSWESTMLKQEVEVMEEYRRAQYAARAELTSLRSAKLARAREYRQKRARKLATLTAQLRDIVRMSRT